MTQPQIVLSGFGDESANDRTMDQQFSAMSAIGLRYMSIRFIDAGNGIKNVMSLDDAEIATVKQKLDEYGLKIATLGSPIGKAKLCDVDDGNGAPYKPFDAYLEEDVNRACDLAEAFETKLLRGFSFYHPKGSNLEDHYAQAVDHVGKIADVCKSRGLIFGLEVEANLIGQNGSVLARMHEAINNDALVTIFDGANIVMQGYTADQVYDQYVEMKPGLGWIHVKDFANPTPGQLIEHVDEETLKQFVPADIGDSGHLRIMKDLAEFMPTLHDRMTALGAPGVFADMEPHVRGGGQFGGFSGPDGMGVALRAFCKVCDEAGVGYHLRDFEDLKVDRGY
ncbi:sugar phosphate isomerase/epimerase family protein [Mariniblastus fucicola]|uniref:Xylose isomerase-like TIM barrel n=1 Tax=Mariniblastus fucicola TaxID=980251 RepID=A0A5B9PS00_9BACT|nr:TIM barrel protein [Mariniblastus fucicola]QEG25033.1 Xylose isomerase-like TIM barrel [Mariniblastus fucicola]